MFACHDSSIYVSLDASLNTHQSILVDFIARPKYCIIRSSIAMGALNHFPARSLKLHLLRAHAHHAPLQQTALSVQQTAYTACKHLGLFLNYLHIDLCFVYKIQRELCVSSLLDRESCLLGRCVVSMRTEQV